MAGSYEHDNEISGPIERANSSVAEEFLACQEVLCCMG